MKTRIVYPQLWYDEKFSACKTVTKLLFMYLITNDYLTLSRYSRISDRRILFETGLNATQLTEAKQELEQLRWCFFKNGEWIYHNHKCAYVDYSQNERVSISKQKEVESIPVEIVRYFNDVCLNTVRTPLEPCSNLNQKSKIINHKLIEEGMGGTKYSTLHSIDGNEIVAEFTAKFSVSEKTVKLERDKFQDKYLSVKRTKQNTFCDFKAAFRNWMRNAITYNPNLVIKNPIPKYQPEVDSTPLISQEKVHQLRDNAAKLAARKGV